MRTERNLNFVAAIILVITRTNHGGLSSAATGGVSRLYVMTPRGLIHGDMSLMSHVLECRALTSRRSKFKVPLILVDIFSYKATFYF